MNGSRPIHACWILPINMFGRHYPEVPRFAPGPVTENGNLR